MATHFCTSWRDAGFRMARMRAVVANVAVEALSSEWGSTRTFASPIASLKAAKAVARTIGCSTGIGEGEKLPEAFAKPKEATVSGHLVSRY